MSINCAQAKQKIILTLVLLLAATLITSVAIIYNISFSHATNIARERFAENPLIIFLIVPLAFLISAYLCKGFAPHSAGSGTAHVLSALSKLDKKPNAKVDEYLGAKTILITITSSIICCAGGGALGSEGPIVQISGSLILFVAFCFKKYLPDIDLRRWIIAASAAGFAIVFNAPFAGILFAIEELRQFHPTRKFSLFDIKVPFVVFIGVFSARYLAEFEATSKAIFTFPEMNLEMDPSLFLSLLLVAILSGIFAHIMMRITEKLAKLREAASPELWFLFPLLFGGLVALISFFVGIYSFGSGMADIEIAMSTPEAILPFNGLFGRFINIIGSLSAGCAGGVLLPSLTMGAYIGSAVSELMSLPDARILISIGMAAFLGAMIRAPLTTTILVLEITGQTWLIFPMIICSFLSLRTNELLYTTFPRRLINI